MEDGTRKQQRGKWNYGTEKLHGVCGGVEIKEAIQKLEKGIGLWDPETAERGRRWARDEGQRGCVSNQQPLQQQTQVSIQIRFCGVGGRGL